MARSRFSILIRLVLLLGLPIAVLVGLFGAGVYLGLTHRERVLSFERDVLRLDVSVPKASKTSTAAGTPPPGIDPPSEAANDEAESTAVDRNEVGSAALPRETADPGKEPSAGAQEPSAGAQEPSAGAQEPSADAQEPRAGSDSDAPSIATEPSASPSVAPDLPERVGEDGSVVPSRPDHDSASLGLPVQVTIKVLVDQDVIAKEGDWIAYVQRLVSQASQVYAANFGVEFVLHGVSTWDVPTRGVRADGLLDDVRSRPREGAQLLVGLTSRPYDADIAGQADLPTANSSTNGAYAVVYASPHHRVPHLVTLLHEIGHIFGAVDVDDTSGRSQSFMNARLGAESSRPWIDPDNRARIISRKGLPFAPSPESLSP